MATIYDLNTDYVSEKLMPPELRKENRLAWMRVLLAGLKKKHKDIFNYTNSFSSGISIDWYDSAVAYVPGDYARVGIARYECLAACTGEFPVNNPDFWYKTVTDFVGTDARKNFYAGKMTLEFVLDLYLQQPNPTFSYTYQPIYIATQGNANSTFMLNNNVSPYLNYMPTSSNFQQNYLANVSTYSAGAVNFIVYVPALLYAVLGTTNADRTNTVRSVVDKYNTAGMTYDVTTY